MAELMIRPGMSDHKVVSDIVSSVSPYRLRGRRPTISRLVIEAQIAPSRPDFRTAAQSAGIPLMIDPLTPLLQSQIEPQDRWCSLPFGQPPETPLSTMGTAAWQQGMVEDVIDFEIEHGATTIIPPYLYCTGPDDPAFEIGLRFLSLTAAYLDSKKINLPVVPVLALQLRSFAASDTSALETFVDTARALQLDGIALGCSPAGDGNDSVNKVHQLFRVTDELLRTGVRVFAWRQGVYGEALVAAGAVGYETGINIRERCDFMAVARNHKPRSPKRGGGGGASGVYLQPLGRSVPVAAARALLGHIGMRAKLMCDDESCCPNGPASTLDHSREHAIRSRARSLQELEAMPESRWRFHKIARDASHASTLIAQANRILRQEEVGVSLRAGYANALAAVATDRSSGIVSA